MFRLCVVLLCIFSQQCIGENSSKNVSDTRTAKIGKGVEVKAYVVYDTEEYGKKYQSQEPRKKGAMWYFLDLFDEVERYFHSRNVMVNFSVIAVEQEKNIWVRTNDTLDTNATLEKLQKMHSSNYSRPNETIVYLFTNKTLPVPGQTETATFATFCTPNVSAAIVVQPPGNMSYTSTVEATSVVFGASGSANFTKEDVEKMNETFSHCHIKRRYKTTKTTTTTSTTVVMNASVN
ncbi:uncharacterized protein LOC119401794 isoform X1 [Rhipicephalus sanguineus]|uniref:uncharacterized protein LOC119401794 isoform X1 n=1 Tax=Rhipicephalus sanguineus TaxID=34632 RepID=UPI0018937BD2|nr:uncharacterized protein LOC119401794 isoform X1 [Rhipicephalus sanguineus]